MSLFLIDLQKTLLVDHGGRRLLALLDHQMDKVDLRTLIGRDHNDTGKIEPCKPRT
jgi:hypothetical protein